MDLTHFLDHHQLRFEQKEPRVLAFLPEAGRFERLGREAGQLRLRFPDADLRPPLFGTLLGVKDVIHARGFSTRAGSRLPQQALSGPEADCVARLTEAGALVLGKTTTSEFAYTAPTVTLNPHNLGHTPGGSSSGSAAAVAAGLCPLALGTQTTGSLIRPAAFCGVVGYKPTYDRISRRGIVPLAPSLDHVGLFARDVTGIQRAARLLCDSWRDPAPTLPRPILGIPEGPYLLQASRQGREHFEMICRRLTAAGYSLLPVPAMLDFESLVDRHNMLLAGEAARVHRRWFPTYGERYEPQTAELLRKGQGISASTLGAAFAGRDALRAELTAIMDVHGLDLWLSPSAPGPAPKGLAHTGSSIMNLPWTYSGLPVVNLPAGKSRAGLPMGLQVSARWHADEELLAWCSELEEAVRLGSGWF